MALILVVDDEPHIGEFMAEAIATCGHEVVVAPHALLAIQFMAQTTPDMVISDLMMPTMNGYELLHVMRATPTLAHVHFILMSAAQPAGWPANAIHPDGFLPKPFTLQALEAILPPPPSQHA